MMEKARIDGFRSETVTVAGVRLHYWIGGPEAGRPVLLWHGFLSTAYAWRDVAPELAKAGMAVLVPDMRGFGDSDKPDGVIGYDARALAEEFRALVAAIGFGGGQSLIVAAHDMGAPPALIWAADHPNEITTLLYIEAPVMLGDVLGKVVAYNREAMAQGSMWWWILPLAPGVPERLIVGNDTTPDWRIGGPVSDFSRYWAARSTLLRLAKELLVLAERNDVDSDKSYLLADVEAAAERWTRYQLRRGQAHSRRWPGSLSAAV